MSSLVIQAHGSNPYTTHDNAGIACWNFKMTHEVSSWDGAAALLGAHGPNLVVGPHMRLVQGVQGMHPYHAVQLYSTEIIRFYIDGTFSVDNGGFNTPTTTERLQAVLPEEFRCFHFSTSEIKGKLGLLREGVPHPRRRREQAEGTLWPLDHGVLVTPDGRIAGAINNIEEASR